MKNLYRVLRTLFVIALVVPLALPVLVYVALSLPFVQNWAAQTARTELTALLGTPVEIGSVEFAPFNRVLLTDVSVADSVGRPILTVGHLGAGVSFSESLWNRRPVVTFAEVIDLELHISRDSAGSPLNIAPIIERFKKKEKTGESKFDLSVNMVVVRRSSVTYDVLSSPEPEEGLFCPQHVAVSDLRADLRAPRIADSRFVVEVKRMGAKERSGLTLDNLSALFEMNRHEALLSDLRIEMPSSAIEFDNISIPSPLSPGFSPLKIATSVATLPSSHISVSDIAPLWKPLRAIDGVVDIDIDVEGSVEHIDINRFNLSVRGSDTSISFHGSADHLNHAKDSIDIDLPRLSVKMDVDSALNFAAANIEGGDVQARKLAMLGHLGQIDLLGAVSGGPGILDFDGSLLTECGDVDIDAVLSRNGRTAPLSLAGTVSTVDFNPGLFIEQLRRLENVSLDAEFDLAIGHNHMLDGEAGVMVSSLTWKGHNITDISAQALFGHRHVDFKVASASSDLDFTVEGGRDLAGASPATELFAHLRRVDLGLFLDKGKFSRYCLAGGADVSVAGTNPDNLTGWIRLERLRLEGAEEGDTVYVGDADLELARDSLGRSLTFDSRTLTAVLDGNFTFADLAAQGRLLASAVFPSVVVGGQPHHLSDSVLARLDISVKPDTMISRLFSLPVDFIQPATMRAMMNGQTATLRFDAPYLRQKDKLIENTLLSVWVNGPDSVAGLEAATNVPTKNGRMALNLLAGGRTDSLDTSIGWRIEREKDFHGLVKAGARFSRDMDGKLNTRIGFIPTDMVFNDSAWHTNPGIISIRPGRIDISDVGAYRSGQTVAINGVAAADSLSRVVIELNEIDLDYLFETLAISDNVMFGGRATGSLYGEAILSKNPVLYTPKLHVDNLAYNHCVMGDGDIKSRFDNNTKTISIDADIEGDDGAVSVISGYIRPATEELVFNFKADNAPVGFMQPFMSAFTSSVSGRVSGDARLFGTFKNLNLEGDIFVEKLKMKLDFTNTVYEVTDSVRLRPGLISFSDVELKDRYGNKAMLTGRVTHEFFHDPTFDFSITEARNLLVYDVGENDTDDPWYGRIFGRGSALVSGVPGRIDIGVTMTTEPKSTFTFVLSDAEESVDYDFITFRDRDKPRKDSIAALDPVPLIVRELRNRVNQPQEGPPSEYVMDFNVDITPEATLNLIMDPIGGDRIVAHGSGHLNMAYDSHGELEMRGEYRLNRGIYTFTLQDIIIKGFSIREGSTIKFSGDPYAAKLDILAAYSTTANLSDLDESFLEDTELNRTNVRVNALLKVSGDMRSPDIGFGLEFPTLTSDIDRKVRSIISTDEMMGQQIIYLLALNRFYTPDYMSATHGNELVSVASSTLSSRLSSMLGSLSENWSIAPAIRSDRGDFSDVEVDLALSSALLDNRLLFNGNFGYRDKSLNNNTFIGDFDIRYLLNRQGTIQLRAYNRYNDQNYYLKSALTTQGVGIVFKRDFDNIFSFLRPLKRKLEAADSTKTRTELPDSVKAGPVINRTDTVPESTAPAVVE